MGWFWSDVSCSWVHKMLAGPSWVGRNVSAVPQSVGCVPSQPVCASSGGAGAGGRGGVVGSGDGVDGGLAGGLGGGLLPAHTQSKDVTASQSMSVVINSMRFEAVSIMHQPTWLPAVLSTNVYSGCQIFTFSQSVADTVPSERMVA